MSPPREEPAEATSPGRSLAAALRALTPAWQSGPLPGEPVADPSAAVAAALAAARPSSEGGAYVEIFGSAAAYADLQSATRDVRPLAGVAVAVKDNVALAGARLGAGSAVHDDRGPEARDAAFVAALRGQGAIPVGRVTLHEMAYGGTGVNAHTGTPLHPVDPARIPGGSSSGSAVAVATGSAEIAIGTDTAGSVRIPAALCGVVGFKPGFGEYPIAGVFPLSVSLDHVGLLAGSVAPIRRAHAAMSYDFGEVRLPRRIGVVAEHVAGADPTVREAVSRALDRLSDAGAEIASCDWPTADRSVAVNSLILLPEATALHRAEMQRHPERFGRAVRDLLESGERLDAASFAAARADQQSLTAMVRGTLADFDVVVGPTMPMVAPLLSEADDDGLSVKLIRFTCLLNVTGTPALSLPLPARGLPVGLQIAAGSSGRLLGAAAALEELLTM